MPPTCATMATERDASIAETSTIAEEAGIPVHINHFGGTAEMYASAEAARERGIDITWDAYPYQAGCTLLSYVLPLTMFSRGTQALMDDLQQACRAPDAGAGIWKRPCRQTRRPTSPIVSLEQEQVDGGPAGARGLAAVGQVVRRLLLRPVDRGEPGATADLSLAGQQEVNDARLRNSLTHPLQMVPPTASTSAANSPARLRLLCHAFWAATCASSSWLRLEDAIRRMTSFPAARFGLDDRGLLRKGMAADLVIFDPQTVMSRATYQSPRLPPVGIEHVFVNGDAVVSNSALTGKRPGRLLRASLA